MRRNTVGQRANAAAEAWALAEAQGKTGSGVSQGSNAKKPGIISGRSRSYFGKLFGANEGATEMARALLRSDPEAAAKAKA
jgi:hypothetical protein